MTERRTRDELRDGLRRQANATRDTADETALMFGGCDDPLHPWRVTDRPFHSWKEFVDQVCVPLLDGMENDDEPKVQEAMRLFRMVNPHFIALALTFAANADPAEVVP